MLSRTRIRGGLTALALVVSLTSVAPSYAAGNAQAGGQGIGGFEADLGQPDLMATRLGLSFAGGKRRWGSKVILSNPAQADVIGVGLNGDRCGFYKVGFRPYNAGPAPSGSFMTKIYGNNELVSGRLFDLPGYDGLPGNGWSNFGLELKQGWNKVQIDLDADREVAEKNEKNNSYHVDIKIDFPCTNVVTPSIGGLKAQKGGQADATAKRKIRIGKRGLVPML